MSLLSPNARVHGGRRVSDAVPWNPLLDTLGSPCLLKRFFRVQEIDDAFEEADDCRNKRPTKDEIQEPPSWLAEIKFMNSKTA